jgi:predicted MPP superfamily phosphohydrolase
MGREMERLKATYGVYAIPGNHDYYAGIDRALDYLGHHGITVLRDQSAVVGNRIRIIGRDDITNKNRKPLALLMDTLNTDLPAIVLDHQPQSLNESVENHVALHLSGHTHNGRSFLSTFLFPGCMIWPMDTGKPATPIFM